MKNLLTISIVGIVLTGCSHYFNGDQKHAHLTDMKLPAINAKVMAKSGSNVAGDLRFTQKANGVQLDVSLKGLKPNSEHGFHIHENGNCSAKDAKSAGGHFNPEGHNHGSPDSKMRHLGDLGNLKADQNGMVKKTIQIPAATIEKSKKFSIFNRAVIVHKDADDMISQPSGNAGIRIGCAVIE